MERKRIDPFLWAHELRGGHVYDIATGLKPSSVRDQVIRARLMIRRALEFGIIQSDDHPLVISGAGLAGVICALEAVENSVPVILVEQEKVPFRLQRRCITRRIDPNLYNWPSHRWDASMYPCHAGDSVPLWFRTNERPHDIVLRWTHELNAVAKAHSNYLQLHYETTIDDVTPDLDAKKTHGVQLSTGQRIEAAMVVFAQGLGKERDTLNPSTDTFRGYRFWDTDPLDHEVIAAKNILIVGSGDGALQDLLRLVLKPRSDLRRLIRDLRLPESVLTEIQALRDHNTAAFLWCADLRHEHDNELFVHERHSRIIDALLTGPRRTVILAAIEPFLRNDVRGRTVAMAHACGHFTHGYAVNRFLALLLLRVLSELNIDTVELRDHTFVTGITCEHDWGRSPRRRRYCFGQKHRVTFTSGECFDEPPKPQSSDRVDYFDAILLRMGTAGKAPIEWIRASDKPLRQFLPDHLAHRR